MLKQQKEAAFTLASCIVFIVLKALAMPDWGDFTNEATLVLLALFILTLWLGRSLLGAKMKELDERDKTIRYQAALIAAHGCVAVLMVYATVLYLLHRGTQTVPLPQVLQLAYFSWISLYVFFSGSILVLYRTGAMNV